MDTATFVKKLHLYMPHLFVGISSGKKLLLNMPRFIVLRLEMRYPFLITAQSTSN